MLLYNLGFLNIVFVVYCVGYLELNTGMRVQYIWIEFYVDVSNTTYSTPELQKVIPKE